MEENIMLKDIFKIILILLIGFGIFAVTKKAEQAKKSDQAHEEALDRWYKQN